MATIFILPKFEELNSLSINNGHPNFKIIYPSLEIIIKNPRINKALTAKNIINQIDGFNPSGEVYLLYHIGDSTDLYAELKKEKANLNTSLYSSGDQSRHQKVKLLINEVCTSKVTRSVEDVIKEFFYDKELEAKLNLLHLCLTPEGAKEAMQVQNYDLIKGIVESVKTEEDQIVVEYLTKQTNCFDEEMYLKPLTNLRDALLLP